MVLGVIMNQTADFQQLQYIDGIVGFSFPGSSAFGYHSLFQALVAAGVYSSNVFALCLTPFSGGVLTLGGLDPSLYAAAPIPWTPLVSTTSYTLTLAGLSVGGQGLQGVPSGRVIIDSGTNNLLLDDARFTAVTRAIQAAVCNATAPPPGVCGEAALFKGSCYAYTQQQVKQFPEITLEIGGGLARPAVPLTVSGAQYLVPPKQGAEELCFGVANTGKSFNIIGDIVMQNYYTIFDLANNRLGWPTAVCPPQV